MTLKEGQLLQNGKYCIMQLLQQGEFSITYKALHTALNQPVVIKIPAEKSAILLDIERQLLAELAQEQHESIVRVRDFFIEDNIPHLVTEFISGTSLYDLVSHQGALLESEALKWIRQIGEALIVIHAAGIIHQDVNPRNILLRKDGRAILIDFGIAKRVSLLSDDRGEEPIAGQIEAPEKSTLRKYTKEFAPYEQRIGRGTQGVMVDVYSLAATLYYLVTGEGSAI